MAMRKAQEDVIARSVAERKICDLLDCDPDAAVGTDTGGYGTSPRGLVSAFPAVEFETGVSKTPDGEKIPMRRLVLTGPWEVDPNGITARDANGE